MKTNTIKTTREKLLSIYNTDPCGEFNNVLTSILKENFAVSDKDEFIIPEKYTSRVIKECSDKQKQLLKEIGIVIKSTSGWSRTQKVRGNSFFLNRNTTPNSETAFHVAESASLERLAMICYRTKQVAEQELKIFNLMTMMRNWARYHNQMDNFVPDWTSGNQVKYGLIIYSRDKVQTGSRYGDNEFMFFISLKTQDRALEMYKEFESEIKEIMPFL